MGDFQLTDLVLLRSHFEMWPEGAALPPAEAEETPYKYPEGDFLKLSASTAREDDEFVVYLDAEIDSPAFPFRLAVLIGARFDVSDPDLEPERAEKTLTWLCYPYVREVIASITTRSPLPPYYLPALTRMPDPAVIQGAPEPPASEPVQ